MRYRTWEHADPEQFFTDTLESIDIAYARNWFQPYADKCGPTRFGALNFYERKLMIHHRIAKHNPLVWAGYLDGGGMTALKLVSPHIFVSA